MADAPASAGASPAIDRDQSPSPLGEEQLARWAALVADGSEPMPAEGSVPPDQLGRMTRRVRALRRRRLVRFIARQVAKDLAQTRGPP